MEDSYIHIVKRTDQWKERAAQSYVVPRGVLCVELTSDGKTKIKVGEGNKYYSQLPYIGNDIDISQYFTKEEVKKLVQDTSEETVIAYMDKQPYVRVLGPILPSAASLPKSGNKDGDIRFVQLAKVTADGKAYIEYVWFNNRWDPLSTALDIDVSKFATKEELAAVQKSVTDLAKRVTLVEQVKHVHPNKGILDAITASFTIEQAAKLAGIEPNANKYVLPIASRRSLGGIIIGEGLLIDASGKVTVDTSGIIVPPYDDTEVKRRISNLETVAHTHANKAILDATTASYTSVEKTKLAGLENYDDTALSGRVTTLEESSHTHTNKSVLDNTTASYTTEEQTKLAGLENYTLPIASNNTLGGIKVGANLSIDQDGILSATGGGESKEYLAGEGISITERSEESDTPVDISSENWVNETPDGGRGSRYTISTDRTYLLQRYSLAAGTRFRVKFVPTNPTDIIYYGFDSYPSNSDSSGGITIIGQTGPVSGFEVDQSTIYTMPVDRNSLDIFIRINDTHLTSSDVVSAASFTELKLIITDSPSQGTFIDANVRDGLEIDPDDNTINVTPATDSTIGGIIVGNNLSIDQNGVLSADDQRPYEAGDGISIDEGDTTNDITALVWEQGSISDTTGTDDDLTTTTIRSPFIETGLTQMVNVSAQDANSDDMVWKAAFYDSSHNFISMTSTWQTISGDDTRPMNARYVRIVLRATNETVIDENDLSYCEISWPIEIGKYVITNTGVTHIEMNGNKLRAVENGTTKDVFQFSSDFQVTSGTVTIPDYQNLVLHVIDQNQ